MQIRIGFSDLADVTAATIGAGVRGRGKARLPEGETGVAYVFVHLSVDEEPSFINLKGTPWLTFFRKVPSMAGFPPGRAYVTIYPQKASLLAGEQISVM